MPATPRWLLAIPDAIRQLEALDRDLLTRRDLERLFGVSRARAATLMQTFGAEMTGYQRTLPGTTAPPPAPAAPDAGRLPRRGDAPRRVVTAIRKARLTGIRVAVPSEALEARSCRACPRACRSSPGPDRGALPRRAGRRRAALRARPGADQRLRAVRGARRRGDAGRGGGAVRA